MTPEATVVVQLPAGEWEERTEVVENGDGAALVDARLYRGTEPNRFLVHESVAEHMMEISVPVLHPDNPRSGDVPLIGESLEDHGQYKPIVVNRGTYSKRYAPWTIGAGNHTLQGAKLKGWTHIGVSVVDVSDDELDRILLVDNRSSDLAYYRTEVLSKVLARIGNRRTGYSDEAANAVHAAMTAPEPREYEEDAADGVKMLRCPNCEHEFPA